MLNVQRELPGLGLLFALNERSPRGVAFFVVAILCQMFSVSLFELHHVRECELHHVRERELHHVCERELHHVRARELHHVRARELHHVRECELHHVRDCASVASLFSISFPQKKVDFKVIINGAHCLPCDAVTTPLTSGEVMLLCAVAAAPVLIVRAPLHDKCCCPC